MSSLSDTKIIQQLLNSSALRIRPWLLAIWILVPFVYYGFAIGATFWVDGFCYSGLAAAFRDADLFREFNSGWGRISLGHLQPGIAVLCWGLDFLPEEWQWPTLVGIQRSVAFASLLWAVLQASDCRPTVLDAAVVSLLVWNPFYQSFHNALLTESLSSSLMLFAAGAAFGLRKGSKFNPALVAIGAIALFFLTNLRSYLGIAALFMLCAAVFRLRSPRSWCLCFALGAFALFSALAYPSVRAANSGDWFLPGNDMAFLLAAGWSSRKGCKNFNRSLEKLPTSARALAAKAGRPDEVFGYDDARLLVEALMKAGKSTADASKTLRELSRALNDDNPDLLEIRARKAAISCGFVTIASAPGSGLTMHRGQTTEQFARQQRDTYKYHSWFWGGDQFDNFFVVPRTTFVATKEGQLWFRRTHEKYVKKTFPVSALDPFLVGRVPFDVWAVIGIMSIVALCFAPDPRNGLILGSGVALNFAVMFGVPLGNPRYAYSLLPLYFLAVVILLHTGFSKTRMLECSQTLPKRSKYPSGAEPAA